MQRLVYYFASFLCEKSPNVSLSVEQIVQWFRRKIVYSKNRRSEKMMGGAWKNLLPLGKYFAIKIRLGRRVASNLIYR